MDLNYRLNQEFSEFDYLGGVERGGYYRSIIRVIYTEQEKQEYLFSDDIVKKMEEIYEGYNEEICNRDLEYLFKKGNIVKYKNDYSQIKTLDELKKKRYRYQLTDKGRLVEEFIIEKLNQSNSLSTTLDPNLLIRFKKELKEIGGVKEDGELHSRWNNIIYAFNLLRGNYRGYLTELNSFEYEKMMEEDKFLLKKARLREYLEDFIKILLSEGEEIREILIELEDEGHIEKILSLVIRKEYEKTELTAKVEYSQVKEKYINQYNRLKYWFIAREEGTIELELLNKATMNIIQKITKMAKQYLDKRKVSYSRKDSYIKVSKMMSELQDIKKVEELSSIIFGDFGLNHLKADYPEQLEVGEIKDADNIIMLMKPIKARKREKISYGIKDRTKEKQASAIEEEKRRQDEIRSIEKYILDNEIILSELPKVTSQVKNILINIIKTGLSKVYDEKKISIRDNKIFYEYKKAKYSSFTFCLLRPEDEEDRAILRTFDGNFDAPNFRIEFFEEVD